MYSIILTVILNWSGTSDTTTAITTFGSYSDVSTCQKIASQLSTRVPFPTPYSDTAVTKYTTAQCVQVKDKP